MSEKSLYGLPEKVIHCQRCVMHNQKPYSVNEVTHAKGSKKSGMPVDEEGVCSACRFAEEKKKIVNWDEREEKLLKLLDQYRRKDGYYDVLVSGSGGKDSMYIAHVLRHRYGMHPLTVTYAPLLYTDVGRNNVWNWGRRAGADNYVFTANPDVAGVLAREGFSNLLHPLQPFKFGIKSFATKLAMRFGIELVMYGESGVEYGSGGNDTAEDATYDMSLYTNDAKDIYLGGVHMDLLKEKYKFSEHDLYPYLPIRSHEVVGYKIRVEHLGHYIKWDPQTMFFYVAENCDFEADSQRTDSTHGKYSGVDDKFESLHFYCQYIKFYIGRCRYDTSQEIRGGHITREEGIALLEQFEREVPERYLADCLDFMGVSEEFFWKTVDHARSPHLWRKEGHKWIAHQELPSMRELI